MRAVIVYESLFGNTRQVAEAVGAGVREAHPEAEVDCVRVDEAGPERIGTADLLIVGGPTHMRGMTSGLSRKLGLRSEKEQADQEPEQPRHTAEEGAEGPGLRDWFHELGTTHEAIPAAAFDTRGDFRFAGGAAPAIARRLRSHGYRLAADPEGFITDDAEGPLREGELDRARAWGATLG
ncbi:flavodoxin domain-containing protein [Streptomyces sp. NPDC006430]|uniref:flavodoxin family protein n=1 Tax=Streptomyces sp. NPDC006430 TaxID=3154299 RepID=UPI00339DC35E